MLKERIGEHILESVSWGEKEAKSIHAPCKECTIWYQIL